MTGIKHDDKKPRFDLLSSEALGELAGVATYGAMKYSDRNWESGMRWGRVFAAMMRHAWRWWGGENVDGESGYSHMAHVMWCAMALLHYSRSVTYHSQDDRPKTTKVVI